MEQKDFIRLGKAIQTMRLKDGMYQKELAKAVSISVSTLSQIENGHVNSSFVTFWKISIAIGFNLSSYLPTG